LNGRLFFLSALGWLILTDVAFSQVPSRDRPASAEIPLVADCHAWGVAHPGKQDFLGLRLGMRLADFRRPVKPIVDKARERELDRLPFVPHTWTPAVGGGAYLHVVRCDATEPIIVGWWVGETTYRAIGMDEWRARETKQLRQITAQPVAEEREPPFVLLLSVKEGRRVPDSQATDYLVLARGCVPDLGPLSSGCAMTFWRTINIRSLDPNLLLAERR
jgi:hypothetical protein